MSSSPKSGSADPFRALSSRNRVPKWLMFVYALSAAVVLASFLVELPDNAFGNIAILVSGFVALVSTLIWRRRVTRTWTASLVTLGLLALAGILFRFEDGTSGELIPRLAFRWTTPHHNQLGARSVESPVAEAIQATPFDFPQFLGPERLNVVKGVHLQRDWSASPPKELWKQPIGDGWSAFAIVGDWAVTMEQRGDDEFVTCLSVLTGKTRWATKHAALHRNVLGGVGPRSTPCIDGQRVLTEGATGYVQCLDLATGEERWHFDIQKYLGVTQKEDEDMVNWGRSGSPLVVGNVAIVPGGGKPDHRVALIALDLESGSVAWSAGKEQVSYSSPAIAELHGLRQILIVNEDSAAAYRADNGEQLWQFPWLGHSNGDANSSQLVPVANDRVFVSKGYGAGAALVEIDHHDDSRWTTKELWHSTKVMKTKFTNVAIHNGYVYGLSDGTLECIRLADGERCWKSGRYKQGQVLLVEDLLLVQAEEGDVFLVEANPTRHVELGRLAALEGTTWNNLALSKNRLLARNATMAACYELPLAE